jgi:hypothetical protein
MSQDRLNGHNLLSIKNIFLINLDYKKIINDFTTKNVKKNDI